MNTTRDPGHSNALSLSAERQASTGNGLVMLLVLLVFLAVLAGGVTMLIQEDFLPGATLTAVGSVGFLFVLCGFDLLQPNQAAAILLVGA